MSLSVNISLNDAINLYFTQVDCPSVLKDTSHILRQRLNDIVHGVEDITEERYSDETVLVQGVIDCYYETPEGIVILDYKTDKVYNDIAELKDKYQKQLDLYEKAIGAMTDGKVLKKVIYSFSLDKEIEW